MGNDTGKRRTILSVCGGSATIVETASAPYRNRNVSTLSLPYFLSATQLYLSLSGHTQKSTAQESRRSAAPEIRRTTASERRWSAAPEICRTTAPGADLLEAGGLVRCHHHA
jgi:hypothetical protein